MATHTSPLPGRRWVYQRGHATSSEVVRHGIATGLIGAAIIAAWFFMVDLVAGRPFYTPTVLGRVLTEGAALGPLAEVQPSLGFTAMFTLVHAGLFIMIGLIAAWLVNTLDHRPNVVVAMIALFVILNFGFVAFALTFPAISNDALEVPQVVIGNLLAALTMTVYAWRQRPHAEDHASD